MIGETFLNFGVWLDSVPVWADMENERKVQLRKPFSTRRLIGKNQGQNRQKCPTIYRAKDMETLFRETETKHSRESDCDCLV